MGLFVLVAARGVVPITYENTVAKSLVFRASQYIFAWRAQRTLALMATRLEPVIEQECRAITTNLECDFGIFIYGDPNNPANDYQTLGAYKRTNCCL